MATKRKTFREYLLEGGVKERYFVRNGDLPLFNVSGTIVYRVTDIEVYDLVRLQYAEGSECCDHLKSCFEDKEATGKQIEKFRAKESKLAEKARF